MNVMAWTFLTTAGLAAGLIGGLFVGVVLVEQTGIDLIGFRIGSAPGFLLFVLASGLIFGNLTARPLRVA